MRCARTNEPRPVQTRFERKVIEQACKQMRIFSLTGKQPIETGALTLETHLPKSRSAQGLFAQRLGEPAAPTQQGFNAGGGVDTR